MWHTYAALRAISHRDSSPRERWSPKEMCSLALCYICQSPCFEQTRWLRDTITPEVSSAWKESDVLARYLPVSIAGDMWVHRWMQQSQMHLWKGKRKEIYSCLQQFCHHRGLAVSLFYKSCPDVWLNMLLYTQIIFVCLVLSDYLSIYARLYQLQTLC